MARQNRGIHSVRSNIKNTLLLFWLKSVKRLTTPAAMIVFACRRHAQRTLLIDPVSGQTLTFADMHTRAQRLAAYFEQRLQPGDGLAYAAPNTAAYFEIRAAAHLAGLVFIPLAAALPVETILYFLEFTGCKALLHAGSLALPITRLSPTINPNLILDIESPDYETIAGTGPVPTALSHHADPEAIATYNISSGTTQSIPKVVRITGRAWVASFYQLMRTAIPAPGGSNRYLCAMPYATAGSTSFLPILMAGMTVILAKEPFPSEQLAAAARTTRASRLFLTPSQLYGLLDHCHRHNERLPDLAMIITGTEYTPVPLLKACIAWFGPKLVCGYGMVEALPPLTQLTPRAMIDQASGTLREDRMHSAGVPIGAGTLSVLDEQGVPVSAGLLGRIAVQGQTLCSGYLNNPAENVACFHKNHFLTSDYGYWDADGFLHVQGRKQDIVAQCPDGQPVFVRDIEERFHPLPCVRQCAATAGSTGEGPTLHVASIPNASETDVLDALNRQRMALEPWLQPHTFVLHSALPLTPLGKLNRRRLAADRQE